MEPGSFQNLGQLLELALNGNRIHLVTADMFQGLEHLRILYLAGNDITRLLDYTFRGLQVKHDHIRAAVFLPLQSALLESAVVIAPLWPCYVYTLML